MLELVETTQIQPEIHTMKAPICKLIITIYLTKKESKVYIFVLVQNRTKPIREANFAATNTLKGSLATKSIELIEQGIVSRQIIVERLIIKNRNQEKGREREQRQRDKQRQRNPYVEKLSSFLKGSVIEEHLQKLSSIC